MTFGEDQPSMIGVKAVQELLLDSEGPTKLNKPLIFHY